MKTILANSNDPLTDICNYAVTEAKRQTSPLILNYNDRTCKVYPQSHPEDIIEKCLLLKQLEELK